MSGRKNKKSFSIMEQAEPKENIHKVIQKAKIEEIAKAKELIVPNTILRV
ncbi:hypothetical protein V3I05_05100 [Helicobacter mastomyrinus]|uniref:Uncharacterized protein n=1 Tax=Helicobacter mastomyrinus TaxID=287948 RepID=A0ABZ3FA72_9HELI